MAPSAHARQAPPRVCVNRRYSPVSAGSAGGQGDRGVAEQQHGVVSRSQLGRLGLSEDAINRRLRLGRLHRVHQGVYAVGHKGISQKGRWMAGVLACGYRSVLSHRSAAALWGIRRNGSEVVHVTLGLKSRTSRLICRHLALLPYDEMAVHEGIPTTTVPRTVLDLASTASIDDVEVVKKFLPFLRRHRLPRPRLNDWIILGERRYQVDCHWVGTGQIVELDSRQAHGTRTAHREDRARDRVLRVAGYEVTRITWAQLDDEPEAIAADLRRLLDIDRQRAGVAKSEPTQL